jgi:endonuclease/exonuclease/phosphatase family metal-dependent hydrolase
MKLIALNAWGGAAGLSGLLEFFDRHKEVDIFCLQEIWNGGEHMRGITAGQVVLEKFASQLYQEIGKTLKNHHGYFRPHFHEWYGLATFVKNDLDVREEGEVFVYKEKGYVGEDDAGNHARNIQYITLATGNSQRTVINFHGLWSAKEGKGKVDTADRFLQSENILRFTKTISHPYVLCGDFNLMPDTKSLKKLEDAGMRNLITEFGIASTRSSFYKKPQRFADYVLVSNNIKVNDFKVLPDEVSDHLAMYVDFE